jgi:hypothetical protein
MKLGRNDLCLCGSKLKYKKCCLSKIVEKHFEKDYSFNDYIKSNNSTELLKIVSLIQLQPKNHSKLVRLETIQNNICSNLSNTNSTINYDKFQRIIDKEFPTHYLEDPSESSFTENLIFLNGNNIVFPGSATGSTNMNQMILNSIFFRKNELSEKTKDKIRDGVILLLSIHNRIAKRLNYERFLFDDDYREKISFPTESYINLNKDLFEFNKEDIESLYTQYRIKDDIIEEFTCSVEEIKKSNNEESLLIIKPFVHHNNKHYLALPTAEMYSLNLFIRRVISENYELTVFDNTYNKYINYEVQKYLGAFWKKIEAISILNDDESLWQFDTNKFAYVCYINNDNLNPESRAHEVIKDIKIKFNSLNLEFLSIHFFASYEIDEPKSFMFEDIKESKYQLALSYFDFERIYTYWDFDKLSLWKYAKAKDRLEKRGTMIAPFFSILTYYKWYGCANLAWSSS